MTFYTPAFMSIRDTGNNAIFTVKYSFPVCLGQYKLFLTVDSRSTV